MYKFCFFLLSQFLFYQINSFSQNLGNLDFKSTQIKANVNVLGIGMGIENRLSKLNTFNSEINLNFSAVYNSSSKFAYALYPGVTTEFRQYYNLYRRVKAGKNTLNNSGNFFGITTGVLFKPLIQKDLDIQNLFILNPAWGIQRSLSNRINFEGRLGWSFKYGLSSKNWDNTPNIRVGFGYILK